MQWLARKSGLDEHKTIKSLCAPCKKRPVLHKFACRTQNRYIWKFLTSHMYYAPFTISLWLYCLLTAVFISSCCNTITFIRSWCICITQKRNHVHLEDGCKKFHVSVWKEVVIAPILNANLWESREGFVIHFYVAFWNNKHKILCRHKTVLLAAPTVF